jgi:hypothetical protein
MTPPELAAPSRVVWTAHAAEKARRLGLPPGAVERVVLERHRERGRNPRAADWVVLEGRLVVAYNHPDRRDRTAARIVTLWRR